MNFLNKFLKNVPLSLVRHSEASAYVREGFGGRPVEEWPVYSFFKQYVEGEEDLARENFEAWYADQLRKYSSVPKSQGGMYQGSLYSLIENKCKAPFSQVGDKCKMLVIKERVAERLKLLEDVRREGYDSSKAERIEAYLKGGFVYLQGGHHRAAALKALQIESMPNVLVFPSALFYNVFRILRRIKNA